MAQVSAELKVFNDLEELRLYILRRYETYIAAIYGNFFTSTSGNVSAMDVKTMTYKNQNEITSLTKDVYYKITLSLFSIVDYVSHACSDVGKNSQNYSDMMNIVRDTIEHRILSQAVSDSNSLHRAIQKIAISSNTNNRKSGVYDAFKYVDSIGRKRSASEYVSKMAKHQTHLLMMDLFYFIAIKNNIETIKLLHVVSGESMNLMCCDFEDMCQKIIHPNSKFIPVFSK